MVFWVADFELEVVLVSMDSSFLKALESAGLLDVQNIACGGRHAALATKQGEFFFLGKGVGKQAWAWCGR